jgi:hypothetical protein
MLESHIVSPSIPSTLASLPAGATAVVRISRSIAVSAAVRVRSCVAVSTSRIAAASLTTSIAATVPGC